MSCRSCVHDDHSISEFCLRLDQVWSHQISSLVKDIQSVQGQTMVINRDQTDACATQCSFRFLYLTEGCTHTRRLTTWRNSHVNTCSVTAVSLLMRTQSAFVNTILLAEASGLLLPRSNHPLPMLRSLATIPGSVTLRDCEGYGASFPRSTIHASVAGHPSHSCSRPTHSLNAWCGSTIYVFDSNKIRCPPIFLHRGEATCAADRQSKVLVADAKQVGFCIAV